MSNANPFLMGFSILEPMNFTKKTLQNGLTLISVPVKDSLSVTVLIMVSAGSKYETKEINGLSHFLEHMCFKGTEKYPTPAAISFEFDKIGSEHNAFTTQEFTGYYTKAHPMHLGKIIDLVSDIYLHSIFDPKEIENEKKVVIEEINMEEDRPHRIVPYVLFEALYDDQPAGWPVIGTKERVSGIMQKDFFDYRSKHYVAEGTTVVVAGNFDETIIENKIEQAFAGIPTAPKLGKAPVLERQSEPVIRVRHKDTDQAHIMIGVRSYDSKNEKNLALKVLNTLLGGGSSSRLFLKVRDEMGAGYNIYSSVDEYTDHGYLGIYTGVDTTRVKEVVAAIIGEMKHLAEKIVPEDELQKAKDYMIGNTYLGLESTDAIAEYYGTQHAINADILTPDQFADRIQKVTAEEVQQVAKEIMQNDRLNMAIVGNITDTGALKDIFHF